MVVQSQPTVTYTWDAANRLTQIQQALGRSMQHTANDHVSIRRWQPPHADVLSNGLTSTYAYDNANQLLSITYTHSSGAAIGNLTYTYDAGGHRTSVGEQPGECQYTGHRIGGSYDAINVWPSSTGSTLAYDGNGNSDE